MRARIALAGLCLVALGSGCRSKKTQNQADVEAVVTENIVLGNDQTSDAGKAAAEKTKKNKFELYPPLFTIYPLSQPEPGHPFHYGYAADAERPFQTVFAYVVAVEPDFQYGEAPPPVILDPVAYEEFMNDWAVEFQRRPELVQKLQDMAQGFAWQVDAQYIEDKPEPIPIGILDEQPLYMRLTQVTLARRFTFKMPGSTVVTGDINGTVLKIPFAIKEYTKAQLDLGKARYEKIDDSCARCHAGPDATRGAYLKHSSDFSSYFTDAQLVGMFKNSANPDGSLFLDGLHINAFIDAAEEEGMVAYLRNMLPWFDKAQSL
jgi:hypothetical protein